MFGVAVEEWKISLVDDVSIYDCLFLELAKVTLFFVEVRLSKTR